VAVANRNTHASPGVSLTKVQAATHVQTINCVSVCLSGFGNGGVRGLTAVEHLVASPAAAI